MISQPSPQLNLGVPLGIWTVDLRLRRCFLDTELAQLFGFSEQDGKNGISVEALLQPVALPDREPMLAQWQSARLSGGLFNARFRVRTAEGPFVPVHSVGSCHRDEAGEPYLFTGQITALKSLDEKVPAIVVDYMIRHTIEFARSRGDDMLVYLLEMAAIENEKRLKSPEVSASHVH